MLWQESSAEKKFVVPNDVVDISFQFDCPALPLDHAWDLSQAVREVLTWVDAEALVGIHQVHDAASSNGWTRPEGDLGQLMQLSRRTRFYLRVPKERVEDVLELSGIVLNVGEHRMAVGAGTVKPLMATDTVFARSVCGDDVENEEVFNNEMINVLDPLGVRVNKMLCGLCHSIAHPDGMLLARSVLLADLELRDAIKLQQVGLGPHRLLGCGILLPHKSLAAVGDSQK